jgi:hypothetical protein
MELARRQELTQKTKQKLELYKLLLQQAQAADRALRDNSPKADATMLKDRA